MQQPKTFLTRMGLFLGAGMIVTALLFGVIAKAFLANPALNGVIVAALLVGVIFAFRRVFDLKAELFWIDDFQKQGFTERRPPRLMAPVAALFAKHDAGTISLSALSMRSLLDGLGNRLEESREISRYLTGLLIFLGLLGTFWGLLGTIGAIGETIRGLSVDGSDISLMFDSLKKGLEAPLSGMGTAFSSSLFGLAGSLILGFLDLQASQAQNRFYNHVEDWLASISHLPDEGSAESQNRQAGAINAASLKAGSAYTDALMEQMQDSNRELIRFLQKGEEAQRQFYGQLDHMAEALSRLSDRMLDADSARAGESKALLKALESWTDEGHSQKNAPSFDEASKTHLRNLDLGIKRLIEAQDQTGRHLADELRAELRLLSKTLAASFEAYFTNEASFDTALSLGMASADKEAHEKKAPFEREASQGLKPGRPLGEAAGRAMRVRPLEERLEPVIGKSVIANRSEALDPLGEQRRAHPDGPTFTKPVKKDQP